MRKKEVGGKNRWMRYKMGGRNKNEKCNGWVIGVKKEVKGGDKIKGGRSLLGCGGGFL